MSEFETYLSQILTAFAWPSSFSAFANIFTVSARMRDSNEIVISDVLITIEGDKNNLQQIEGTSITENNGANNAIGQVCIEERVRV